MPLPPGDNMCKWYLDKMTEMVDDLESDCIFLHVDEAVYCKMMMVKWLNQGQYDKIIPLFGGFHRLLVKLKFLHKKFGVLGLKEWWIDSEAIQPGSANKADEGRHYFRSVRIQKQSFEALIRYRILKEVNIDGFSATMKTRIADLKEDPNSTNLDKLMNEEEFLSFSEQILKTSDTMSQMTISYIK